MSFMDTCGWIGRAKPAGNHTTMATPVPGASTQVVRAVEPRPRCRRLLIVLGRAAEPPAVENTGVGWAMAVMPSDRTPTGSRPSAHVDADKNTCYQECSPAVRASSLR